MSIHSNLSTFHFHCKFVQEIERQNVIFSSTQGVESLQNTKEQEVPCFLSEEVQNPYRTPRNKRLFTRGGAESVQNTWEQKVPCCMFMQTRGAVVELWTWSDMTDGLSYNSTYRQEIHTLLSILIKQYFPHWMNLICCLHVFSPLICLQVLSPCVFPLICLHVFSPSTYYCMRNGSN